MSSNLISTGGTINYKDYLVVKNHVNDIKQQMLSVLLQTGNTDYLTGSTPSCITDYSSPSASTSDCYTTPASIDWVPFSNKCHTKYSVNHTNCTFRLSKDDLYGDCDIPVKAFDFTIYKNRTYGLPDGAKLIVDDKGNYTLEDKDAKVTYKACNIRDFNPYLNASDLLAKFVEYVGKLHLTKTEVLKLPIELFIAWLILEAAAKDGDPQPQEIPAIPQTKVIKTILKPRCLDCGRFIPRNRIAQRFEFCGPEHSSRYGLKLALK